MEKLSIINVVNLEGIKTIKCDLLLKSSWNHSTFVGVVVSGEYTEDGCAKIMTVEQMKAMCTGQPEIQFVNANRSSDVIFKYVDKRIGFLIDMNSDTKGKVISSEIEKLNRISQSPAIKIEEEFAEVFRVSADNIITTVGKLSDYEIIRGLVNQIIPTHELGAEVAGMTNAREQAYALLKPVSGKMNLF